ncbi:MAG: hypothetical protein J6M27_07720, partial [Lachnospiraceae bacterium]|nr:hypothetical protein [Lachnospiraceae bacterium]
SREQLGKLLDDVMISYQRSFKEQYSKTWDAQLVDLNLEEYDYIQQLSILNDRMDQVDTYASQMYQKEFRVMLEGQTFNDIHIRIRNLSDNEIPRLRAMVVLGGLSKNPERLLMQYEYEIENLLIQLRNQKDRLTEVELLLEAYEKNEVLYIGSGDAFTKIDGNSSQTYDQLVAERRSVANGITDIKTDISDRLLRMGDILGDEADSSEYIKQVNDMLAEQIDEEEYQQILDEVTEESGENPEDTENGENVDTEGEENGEFQDEARLPKDNTHISTRKGRGDSVDGVVELEADINGLVDKISEIENDFKAMLDVYNEQQFNDMTISLSPSYVNSKRLVSGAFVKTGIKYAGPFVSIGIMICVVMVLLDMKKKEKAAEKEVVE